MKLLTGSLTGMFGQLKWENLIGTTIMQIPLAVLD